MDPQIFYPPGTPKIFYLITKITGGRIKIDRKSIPVLMALCVIVIVFSFFLFYRSLKPAGGGPVSYPPDSESHLQNPRK